MPKGDENSVFSALLKWGDRDSSGEDFYTKSLVLILNRLKTKDVGLVRKFLNDAAGLALETDDFQITPHTGNEAKRRPDITVESARTLAYIEVKVDDKPRKGQLEDYRDDLTRKAKVRQKPVLLLLTRYRQDKDWGIPDWQFSWVEVWEHLASIEENLKDPFREPYELVRDFRLFLKEKEMGAERVSQMPDSESLQQLLNLMDLAKIACNRALGLDSDPRAHVGFGGLGWYFRFGQKQCQYWCGLYLDNPQDMIFEMHGTPYKRLSERVRKSPALKSGLDRKYGEWWFPADTVAMFKLDLPDDFDSLQPHEQMARFIAAVHDVLHDTKDRK